MPTDNRSRGTTRGKYSRKRSADIPSWLGLPPRLWLVGTMICGAAAMRLLPHPLNFAPIGAMALFAGAQLPRPGWAPAQFSEPPAQPSEPPAQSSGPLAEFLRALPLPLGAMLLSDVALEITTGWGFHRLMPAVYGSFALIVGMGLLLRCRPGVLPVATGAVGASISFFIITNFAVWAQFDSYPHTAAGLAACYLAALPYFWNTLAGDLFYSAVLFGGFALTARRFSIFASEGQAPRAGGY